MTLAPAALGRLIRQLRVDEGVEKKPYKDAVGKVTIGIGRNLDDRGLSDDEIEYLCANDIRIVEVELDRHAPWWKSAPEGVQIGLANMCFNLGWPRLSGFKKMLGCLERGEHAAAAEHALDSKWAEQVGERAERIADLFRGKI